MKKYLIFTDLDGTLLNHDDYNFGSNDLLINKIIFNSHKIIFNSSKTFKEILFYINKFNLHNMPFSVENGASIYFPKKVFSKPKKAISDGKYWALELTHKKSHYWKLFLEKKTKDFEFEILEKLPVKTIRELTNIKNINNLINRNSSQLIVWKDSLKKLSLFKKELTINQGQVIKGGRFHHISSICNKRIATQSISHEYNKQFNGKYYKKYISLGDNQNDLKMLNSSSIACVIKTPMSQKLKLHKNKKHVFYSKNVAPNGWKETLLKVNYLLKGALFND